jgi:hypothetical protein
MVVGLEVDQVVLEAKEDLETKEDLEDPVVNLDRATQIQTAKDLIMVGLEAVVQQLMLIHKGNTLDQTGLVEVLLMRKVKLLTRRAH